MSGILERILSAPEWLIVTVVTLIVFAEDAIFVGFVIPGETAAILGGVAASLGEVQLWLIWLLVVVAAVVGDSVGYELGRHFGPRILRLRIFAKHQAGLEKAQDYLRRRGGWAVLLGRWTAFFRAVMPALAGMSRMPYRTFVTFNAIGGVIWGSVVVWAGYLAGHSYRRIERWFGTGGLIVAAVVIIGGIVILHLRKRRRERAEETAYEATHPDPALDPAESSTAAQPESTPTEPAPERHV